MKQTVLSIKGVSQNLLFGFISLRYIPIIKFTDKLFRGIYSAAYRHVYRKRLNRRLLIYRGLPGYAPKSVLLPAYISV